MVAKVAPKFAVGQIVRSFYRLDGDEVAGAAEVLAVHKAGRTFVYDLSFLGNGEPDMERNPESFVDAVIAPSRAAFEAAIAAAGMTK